jgi:hypothetical protein
MKRLILALAILATACGSGAEVTTSSPPPPDAAHEAAPTPPTPDCGLGIIYSFNPNNPVNCCGASIYTLDQDSPSMCGNLTVGGSVYGTCDCPTGTVCHKNGTELRCGAP